MPTTTLMAPSFWWSTPGVLAYLRPASADAPSPVLPSDPNLRFRRRARADDLVRRSEPDAFASVSPQRSPHLDLHKEIYQPFLVRRRCSAGTATITELGRLSGQPPGAGRPASCSSSPPVRPSQHPAS